MAYRHGSDALISNLSFEDDMIIFANGQKQSIRRVLQCIEHYEGDSGQLLNRDTSGIILLKRFSTSKIHRLEHLIGFHHQQQPFTIFVFICLKEPRKSSCMITWFRKSGVGFLVGLRDSYHLENRLL
ncbi:Reverse transcriptase domain-containing protein [Abeliophyllum distichum]|uniref:Reverse transcriptase domain-containing protein n=1 Tax=Abeliophyllum distichum TaxID=126358 RepID=A0ABD1VXL5_9LAMI